MELWMGIKQLKGIVLIIFYSRIADEYAYAGILNNELLN